MPQITDVKTIGDSNWLALQSLTFLDQEGKERKWDMATRKNNASADGPSKAARPADCVIIVPVLRSKKNGTVETLLVEQFRPPLAQMTTEFPAGLIDGKETPEQAALRELLEETGYTGKAVKVSPQVCMEPGLCDESAHVVVIEVDLDTHGPVKAEPDDGEFITLKRVNFSDGLEAVLAKNESHMPFTGLQAFAMGLEVGKSIKTA